MPGGRTPTATRDAPIGGQAVLEGVMMRGVSTWALGVRKESGIEVRSFPLVSWTRRRRVYRMPVIRGVVALVESLGIGLRALQMSASAQMPEGGEELSGSAWVATVAVSLVFAIGLFFLAPVGLASLIRGPLGSSSVAFWAVEGVIRIAILIGYLALLTRIPDLHRVFQYHGAEHKTIACFEASDQLTPENAQRHSRLHPRCGTSFLLIVMVVAILVFAPIGVPAWYILLPTRIVGIPLIAGVSFELIRWAGRNRGRRWVKAIIWPGLQLQKLTTREPDLGQLAVAIAALEAVLAVETPGDAGELVGVEVVA